MKFGFDESYNLKIELDPTSREKLDLLSEFSRLSNLYKPMTDWINSKDTSKEDKKQYNDAYINATGAMATIYKFLRACGISDKEIQEWTKIPF